MQLEAIRSYVADDIDKVDHIIAKYLGSDIDMIREVGEHIFGSGGKRLRPTLVILGARAFDYQDDNHLLLAGVVELIHTATLLHDDVVDESSQRRGKTTANEIWGNHTSVLVGDFVYSRAFQMMVQTNNMQILQVLADASNIIAEGEVLQLVNCNNTKATESHYIDIIQRKTATLFQAAAQLGPILCNRTETEITAMASFGLDLGIAFQIIDDALDYGASQQDIGKNLGDDLAEGNPTLPLIYIMENGNNAQKQLIEEAIKNGGTDRLTDILEAIAATNALQYTYDVAKKYIASAKQQLKFIPESEAKTILAGLADFAISRTY